MNSRATTPSSSTPAEQFYINPVDCIGCGLCVEECPVRAIFPEDDLPPEWSDYLSRNASYYNK